MRVFDEGAFFRVSCSADDVSDFNSRWPCSQLDGPVSFTFDKKGDLVDTTAKVDGPEVVALSEDAQTYGEVRLKAKQQMSLREAQELARSKGFVINKRGSVEYWLRLASGGGER